MRIILARGREAGRAGPAPEPVIDFALLREAFDKAFRTQKANEKLINPFGPQWDGRLPPAIAEENYVTAAAKDKRRKDKLRRTRTTRNKSTKADRKNALGGGAHQMKTVRDRLVARAVPAPGQTLHAFVLRLAEANAHPGSAWIRRIAGLPRTFASRPCDLTGLEAALGGAVPAAELATLASWPGLDGRIGVEARASRRAWWTLPGPASARPAWLRAIAPGRPGTAAFWWRARGMGSGWSTDARTVLGR